MEFFCYHRDRPGSMPLRSGMVEQHWSYMDQFAATMIARGPTFASDGTLTGSVHILDLPDPAAARTFAFEEPGYQAGAYRDVLLRRWRNSLGRTMWEFNGGRPHNNRYPSRFTPSNHHGPTELPLRGTNHGLWSLFPTTVRCVGAGGLLEPPKRTLQEAFIS